MAILTVLSPAIIAPVALLRIQSPPLKPAQPLVWQLVSVNQLGTPFQVSGLLPALSAAVEPVASSSFHQAARLVVMSPARASLLASKLANKHTRKYRRIRLLTLRCNPQSNLDHLEPCRSC